MKTHSIIRLCPCPEYEIEKMQCWLQDMAAQGWLLTEDSFFLGFAVFEKTGPRRLRYRLDAAPKPATLFNGRDEPDDHARALNEEFGWEYVTRRGQFYIYRTEDPNVPELHTDPAIQEETIRVLSKRLRSNLLGSIFEAVFLGWLYFGFMVMIFTTFLGTPMVVWGLGMLVTAWCSQLHRLLRLGNMSKRLREGRTLTEKAQYTGRAQLYRVWKVLCVVLPIAWFLCLGVTYANQESIPMEDYSSPLPFATIEDLFPGAEVTYYDNFIDSYVKEYSDILTPETYEIREYADTLTLPDGTKSYGILHVNYHRTVSPILAQRLCWEYEKHYDRQNSLFSDEERTYIELGDIGADFAVCYRYDGSAYFIIRVDNEMVRGLFHFRDYNTDADLQRFCRVMAQSFKEDNQ